MMEVLPGGSNLDASSQRAQHTEKKHVVNAITPRRDIFILTESTGLSLGIFALGYQSFNDFTFRNNKLTRYFAITLNKARLLLIAITFLGINLTN